MALGINFQPLLFGYEYDEDGNSNTLPEYSEINTYQDLKNPQKIFKRLDAINWAFTKDITTYLSHDVHPYPAKFIPQIPGSLISSLTLRGELVLDPFGGCGTTALEALRLGRRAISIDANPLATLIGEVKSLCIDDNILSDLKSIITALSLYINSPLQKPEKLIKTYEKFIPNIPNLEKWFPITSCGELALIKSVIENLKTTEASKICLLAMSRIIIGVSFQDSETRYTSVKRDIPPGLTIKRFLDALYKVLNKSLKTIFEIRYGVSHFLTTDFRNISKSTIKDDSIDLIATSPPYGNAYDYHLYHRFRMFWLGYDPGTLAKIEIGSHLRHQKENTGFKDYVEDMRPCLMQMFRVLKPGRYAALVLGTAIYKGIHYDSTKYISELAEKEGFQHIGCIKRPIHAYKRYVTSMGRRANEENIVLFRKPPQKCNLSLFPPTYKMWPYERDLRIREINTLLGAKKVSGNGTIKMKLDPYHATNARRLVFSKGISLQGHMGKTWQEIIENGFSCELSSRKDPKYVTHGIHKYKGKFYPQLAKGLINISGIEEGAKVFDPFCGSGTTLLESWLNGLRAYGCDLHPLAAKIAKVKVGVLGVNPDLLIEVINLIEEKITKAPDKFPSNCEQFESKALDEINNWFTPIIRDKINWLLGRIRSVSSGVVRDFLEIILSDMIRDVSHQDPFDLRIRKRKNFLRDADVLGMFKDGLQRQILRIQKFWKIRGYCPYKFSPAQVIEGDSRLPLVYSELGLKKKDIDLILTSPPYATALPYIDTDRLSLLVLYGMTAKDRRPLEQELTGSREILQSEKIAFEKEIEDKANCKLPIKVIDFIKELYISNKNSDVGFRRKNLPALLLRFFKDIQIVITNCKCHLKRNGEAVFVIGDSYTLVNGKKIIIPTTKFLEYVCVQTGLNLIERIPISVTTENLKHIQNAITENTVLRFKND